MSKSFHFHVPVELTKSEDESEWRVRGIASTPDQDLQGEIVDQNGLDISPLKAGNGLFNWDHQKGPENILGQIESADFIEVDGKKCLMVDGYLFKNQERSKAFYNIMSSMRKGASPRVHMSIEGKILGRDPMNPKAIRKARIDKVALTMDPVNPYTYAQLVKSLAAPEEIQTEEQISEETITMTKTEFKEAIEFAVKKALAAGAAGAEAPQAKTGGAVLMPESLDKKPKKMQTSQKNKQDMVKSVLSSLKKAHPEEDPMMLAEWAIEMFLNKLDFNKGDESE